VDGFWWNSTFELFSRKSVEKIPVSLKPDKKNEYFTWRFPPPPNLTISRWILLRMRNVSDKSSKHNCMFKNFSQKSSRFWDVGKCGRAREMADDNIIRCMRFASCISKATCTHVHARLRLDWHGNSGYVNAPQCYVYTYIAYVVEP
jgi:hypothetical protein